MPLGEYRCSQRRGGCVDYSTLPGRATSGPVLLRIGYEADDYTYTAIVRAWELADPSWQELAEGHWLRPSSGSFRLATTPMYKDVRGVKEANTVSGREFR